MTSAFPSSLEPLLRRRSVVAKNLIEPGPGDHQLEMILKAGVRVPDHGKIGPWRLQVLRKPVQAMLGEVYARVYAASNPDARADQIEAERARPSRAPVLIVVSTCLYREHKIPEIEQLLSCGAVCQNLLNAATLLGYSAQWLTEWPAYDERIKEALGIPADQHIIGFVSIGSAAEPPNERPRPDFDSIVSFPTTLPVNT
ncbi:MAG: nitroreductase family protein [Geminicoccaceae bacterium]